MSDTTITAEERARAKENSDALTAAYMSGKYDGRKEAEANVARLTKELDWLAERCSEELGFSDSLFKERKATVNEWKEAARRAVAAVEESCQK